MHLTAVVITHKLERYVDRAIASVVTQTRRPDRIVALGTDCRPETLKALHKWSGQVEIVMTGEPLTCCASKNVAATVYVREGGAFFTLDADDWINPHFVEKCMGCMERGGYAAVGCDYQIIDGHGFVHQAKANTTDIADMATANPLPSCSIIRRNAFDAVGGYDESFSFEDWAFWLKLKDAGYPICRYPIVLYNHLRHATNKTNTDDRVIAHKQITDLVERLSHARSRSRNSDTDCLPGGVVPTGS